MNRAIAAACLLFAVVAQAQVDNQFVPAGGNYGTAASWSLGHVPDSNDVARIAVTNSVSVTNAAGTYAAGSLSIGAISLTGTLTVAGGQLSYASGATLSTNGATANLINSGGALIFSNSVTLATSTGTATYASITNKSGTLRVEGNLQLGIHSLGGGGARGMLAVNGGTVTVTGNLATANATAYSYIRLNGGVLEVAGVTHAGSATERVLYFNGGTLRALRDNAAFVTVAGNAVQMSNLVQNGGAFIDTQGFSILIGTPIQADGASVGGLTKLGAGTLTLTNAAASNYRGGTVIAQGTLSVGNNAGESATALGIGLVTVSNGATLHFKPGSTATSYSFTNAFYVDGGTIIGEDGVQRMAANSTFTVGPLGANVKATWNTKDVYIDGQIIGNAELALSHGPTAGGAANIHIVNGANSYSGTVSVSGAGLGVTLNLDTATGLQYAAVNLNPGTPGTMMITPAGGATVRGLSGSGGTVKPAAVAGMYTLTLRSADAFTFGGALSNNTGILALNKAGSGTQTLSGASTYSGDTMVSGGTLALGAGGSIGSSTTITVGAGAVLDVTAKPTLTLSAGQVLRGSGLVTGHVAVAASSRIHPGSAGTPGTLTVGGNVTLNALYEQVCDLTNSTAMGGGTNDLLVVRGDLDAQLGSIRVNPLAPLVSGTYRLIQYAGAETLPFSPTLLGNNSRDVMVLDDTGTGVVDLIVTAGTPQSLRWNPVVSTNWNFAASNWVDVATGTVTDRFYDLDTVVFDDAGGADPVVNLAVNVRPTAVNVNGGNDYTFAGPGRIQDRAGGPTPLAVMLSGGSLTLFTTNDYTGGTVLSNGVLGVGANGALGAGALTVFSGTLAAAGGNQTVSNAIGLAGASAGIDDGGFVFTISSAITGSASVVKVGRGTLNLLSANSYTGGTTISMGTIRIANNAGTPGTVTLGDFATGTNGVAWLFAGSGTPTNNLVVSSSGTGPATLGSYSAGTATAAGGTLTLNRPVTMADATGDRTTFNGKISGAVGTITITGSRITFGSGSNDFSGNLVIPGGSIYQSDHPNALPTTTSISNNGTFRLNNGGTHTIDALSGTGSVNIIAGGVATLSLGNAGGSGLLSGPIVNGASALTLIKTGAGTQTLSATNTYTGNTTINGGTLALAGGGTIGGSPQILVGAAGTFDVSARPGYTVFGNQILFGTGSVTGDVVTAAGAQIRPGGFGFVGTLTFKNALGLNAGSTNWFDLTGALDVGGGTNDLVAVAGLLEPSNSVLNINVTQPLASGTYTLFTYTGVKATTFNPAPILSISPGRKSVVVDETVPGQVNLNVSGSYGDLVWMPQTNASWNFADNNWSNTASAVLDTFFQSDSVTFDERGAYSNVVTLTTTSQPTVVTVNGTSNYTFQGAGRIQGLASLVKDGAGTLVIGTTNTFTGPVTISGGVLRVAHSNALGTAAGITTVKPGGMLDINGINLSPETVVAEGGSVLNNGAVQLNALVDFRVTGSVLIGGSNRWDVRPATARTWVSGGATLSKGAGGDIVYLGVDGALTNDGVIAVNQGRIGLWNTTIRGTGSFTVASGALLAVESATANPLPVTLNGGGLGAPTGTTLSQQQGPVLLTADSLLVATSGPFTVSGVISNSGGVYGFTKNGANTVNLTAANSYQGGTVVAGGTLAILGGTNLGAGPVTFPVAGVALSVLGTSAVVDNNLVLGPVTGNVSLVTPNSSTTTVNGTVSGGGSGAVWFFQGGGSGQNTGFLVLTGTNTLQGTIDVERGPLVLGNAAAAGSALIYLNSNNHPDGALQFLDSFTITNRIQLAFGTQNIGVTGAQVVGLAGQVLGANSLAKVGQGTLVLTGTNSYSGTTTVSAGTLQVGVGGLGGSLGAGAISNMGALVFNRSGALAVQGSISGTGAVMKLGGGTCTFHGANSTYTGPTYVQAGRLDVNGTNSGGVIHDVQLGATLGGTGTVSALAAVAAGATVEPGSGLVAGSLKLGQAALSAGAAVNVLANGTDSVLRVTAADGLTVPSGSGTAVVNVVNGLLATGTYTVIDYAGTIQGGAPTNLVLGIVPPRTVMYLTNNAANTSIDLVVVTAGEPIKWLGGVNANWDINVTTNWVTVAGAVTTAYQQAGSVGDSVLLDDSALGNFTIALLTNVSPVAVIASNAANDYAITGGFGIGGATSLRKYGAGKLTLATPNTYAGGTLIAAGTLQVGTGGAGATLGGGFVTNNSSLVFNHGDAMTLGTIIAGTGSVTKDGAGSLTLLANQAYAGDTTVNAGTLAWTSTATWNSIPGNITINGGLLDIEGGGRQISMSAGKVLAFGANGGTLLVGPSLNFFQSSGFMKITTAGGVQAFLSGNGTNNLNANAGVNFEIARGSGASDLQMTAAIWNTGALNKSGNGILELLANNPVSGLITISNGVLALGAGGSISNSPTIAVISGATFDVSAAGLIALKTGQTLRGGGLVQGSVIASPASRLVPGTGGPGGTRETLTINGSAGLHAASTNYFNLGPTTNAGGGFNDLVAISGDLEPSNSALRIDVDFPPATGVYRLMTYGGAKATAFNPALELVGLSLGRKGLALDESVANQINLVVTGAYANLVWLPQTNASWNFADANWSNTTSAALETFFQSDSVQFDERGAYSNVVTLTSTTQPAVVTVSGASNYTFQGLGGIGGAATLTKSGAGTLVVTTTNTYSGLTTISNGTLQVGAGGPAGALAGAGVIQIDAGATLLNYRNDPYTANVTLTRNVAGTGNWIVRGSGVSGQSDYFITGSQTGFTGTLTIDKARFEADSVRDAGFATINVLTGGQFWAFGAGNVFSNALTIAGQGWQEGALYGALRLQNAGVNYAGPITLANGARIGAIQNENWVTNTISGGYDLETYGYDGNSRLVLSGNNTFNDLRPVQQWTYVTRPDAVGTGKVVMAGGGFSPLGADLTITNALRAETTIHLGYHPTAAERRRMTWTGPWDLNGASRTANIYNTNTILGTVTNGGLEVAQDGLMVFNGDLRLANLYVDASGVNGNIRQDGGTVTVANAAGNLFRIGHWSTTGNYTMNGGVLSNVNGAISVGWDGAANFAINGGTVYSPQVIMDDGGYDNPARLSLNGGSLLLGAAGLSVGATGYVVNLEGGTLGAYAGWSSPITLNLNNTNGGVAVNPAGNTIALHGLLVGTGSLSKVGSGMLALNGTYNAGPIGVSGGELGGTGTVNAAVTVNAGGALQPGYAAIAGRLSVTTVTFAAGAQFNPLVNGTACVLRVVATNGLTVPSGTNTLQVNVLNAGLGLGTYTIIDYAGAIQGGADTNVALGIYPPRSVMYLTNNAANTSIDLVVVTLGESIKWVGSVDGNWNIAAPTNWVTAQTAVPTAYQQAGLVGDALVFDDTASGNFAITLQTNANPSSMVASNAANDYAITGGFGIGGLGSLRKYGAAKFTLNTTNSFSGGTLIRGGTLQVSGSALGSGPVSNDAALVFSHSDNGTMAAVISGTGTVTKEGAGTLTLSGFSTYTNVTTVNGGTLQLSANSGSAGTLSGPLTINAGATVVLTVGNALGYAGTPWIRTINIVNGTLATAVVGDNGWNTTINMTAGSLASLVPGGYFSMGFGLSSGNGATFNISSASVASVISANLAVRDNAGAAILFNVARGAAASDLDVSGNVLFQTSGGITKSGGGVMVLSGTNTYTGGTAIIGGTLAVDLIADSGISRIGTAGGSANYLAMVNGTLRYTGMGTNITTRYLWIDQPQVGSTFEISQATGTLILSPSGGNRIYPIIKTGPGTLVLNAACSGATTVSNGTLVANGVIGAGIVTIDAGATLSGTGLVKGVVSQNGIVSPGTGIGILTVSNQVNCGATAVTRFELGGTNSYDQLVVSDLHTLNGTLEVVTTNGYVPVSGDRFNLITNTALGGLLFGPFPSTSLPALPSGMGWEVQYSASDAVNLVVTGSVVTLTAYEQWAAQIPNPADRGDQNDADNDGYANLLEYSQGSDPTNNANNAKLNLVRTNGMEVIVFNRVNTATDIVYEVQASYAPTNNAEWQGLATNSVGSWGSSTNVNDDNTATIHRVWVSDLVLGTNRSLRLKITRP